MRRIFLALMMMGTLSYAQEVASNTELKKVYDLDAKSGLNSDGKPTYKETGSTAIYHGEHVPVYMTSRGKLFIWVTSKKTGTKYKKYIK
jgi:hypothetical protein